MTRFRRLTAAAASLALVCSSAVVLLSPAQAGAQKAKAKAPLEIGFVCQCTGPEASSLAIGKPAYQAWARYQNAHGGINGHKVKVIVKDDASNPGTSLAVVEHLVAQDHVAALVDNTNLDSSWATYVQQHHVPVIGMYTNTNAFYTNPYFFPEGQTQDAVNTSMVLAAKKMHGKQLAYLYCSEAPVCAQGVKFLAAAGKKLGVPVIYSAAISASQPNYTAQCLAAKQSGADVLWVAQVQSATMSAVSDCADQGFTPIQLATSSGVARSFATAKGLNNHLITTQPVIPFSVRNTKGTKAMYRALERYSPSVLTSSNFNVEVSLAWVSGLLLDAAAKAGNAGKGGAVTSGQLLRGLYSMHGETLGGMAPPLTFEKGKPHPVDCWFYMRAQKGHFTTPYGIKPVCHEPVT